METFIKALGVQGEAILILAISFIILVLVLKKVLFNPLVKYLDNRNKEIKDNFDQIEQNKKEIGKMKDEYQAEMQRIEKTAYDKMQKSIKEGLTAKTEIISEAHAQADKVLRKAKEEIEQEKKKALVELKKEVVTLSIQTTSKVIGESMNKNIHHKLVDKFVADLEEKKK